MKKILTVAAAGLLTMGATATAMADAGEKTYKMACFACHGTGAAGAPKLGDKAAWAPRIKQGKEILYKHAIEGFKGSKGVMPAKGGRTDLSDADVKASVDYIIAHSQ